MMIRTILVAVDGSDHAKKALALGSDLAAKYAAKLVLVHALLRDAAPEVIRKLAVRKELSKSERDLLDSYEVEPQMAIAAAGVGGAYVPVPPPRELLEPIGRQILARAEEAAKKAGVKKVERVLMSGDPADAILAEAKRAKPNLIVLGTRGFGDFKSLVLGSVSHKVASQAPCAVTTVK